MQSETWHVIPEFPLRPVVCMCKDGTHSIRSEFFIVGTVEQRDQIIADHTEASALRTARDDYLGRLTKVEMWLQQVDADKDVLNDPRCLPGLWEAIGTAGADWLMESNNKIDALRTALTEAQAATQCEHVIQPEYGGGRVGRCKNCGIELTLGWTPYEAIKAALRSPTGAGTTETIKSADT